MKILNILTIAAITLNVGIVQAACEGGTLTTGPSGHEFCISTKGMNWWSAYAWCEANGRHFASIYELCPTWDGSIAYHEDCKLARNSSWATSNVWTATASGNKEAIYVDENGVGRWERYINYLALCY